MGLSAIKTKDKKRKTKKLLFFCPVAKLKYFVVVSRIA